MCLLEPVPVPPSGELALGAVYARSDLHARFGGNRQCGIVPSLREPVILVFHTEEKVHQFYGDGWDSDGVYWYSGEGVLGDMEWTRANVALRDHSQSRSAILLFERAQRQHGLWRFIGGMRYVAHRYSLQPDREGRQRRAIVFALLRDGEVRVRTFNPDKA